MGWKMRATAFGLEALGRSIARRSSSTGKVIDNASSKNIFNSKNLNEGEDERVREWGNQDKKTIPIPERKPQTPMNREVSSWSEEDVEEIMKTKAYQFDNSTQKKYKVILIIIIRGMSNTMPPVVCYQLKREDLFSKI